MRRVLIGISAILTFVWLLAPIVWMVSTSFATQTETLAGHLLPEHPTLDNYKIILGLIQIPYETSSAGLILPGIRTSAIVALAVMSLNIVIGAPAAYAFASLPVPLKNLQLWAYLLTRLVPVLALVVPLFILLRVVGLINTLGGLIIAELAISLPITVWFLVAYLRSIPRDLDRAARTDGASDLRVFWYVIAPLMRPGLIGAAVLAFMSSWNDFLLVLILLSSPTRQTIQPILAGYTDQLSGPIFGLIMAGATLAALPPMALAGIFQRHLSRGLTSGALVG